MGESFANRFKLDKSLHPLVVPCEEALRALLVLDNWESVEYSQAATVLREARRALCTGIQQFGKTRASPSKGTPVATRHEKRSLELDDILPRGASPLDDILGSGAVSGRTRRTKRTKTGPSVDTPSAVLAGDPSFSEPRVVQGSPFSAFRPSGDIRALTEQVEGLTSSLKEVSRDVSVLRSFERMFSELPSVLDWLYADQVTLAGRFHRVESLLGELRDNFSVAPAPVSGPPAFTTPVSSPLWCIFEPY